MRDPFVAVDVPAFRVANDARARTAAKRDAARAHAVLDSPAGVDLRPVDRTVLTARVEHPDLSLTELARLLGVSKDTYACRLSRALSNQERTR